VSFPAQSPRSIRGFAHSPPTLPGRLMRSDVRDVRSQRICANPGKSQKLLGARRRRGFICICLLCKSQSGRDLFWVDLHFRCLSTFSRCLSTPHFRCLSTKFRCLFTPHLRCLSTQFRCLSTPQIRCLSTQFRCLSTPHFRCLSIDP